jgi:hypothetical protein
VALAATPIFVGALDHIARKPPSTGTSMPVM